MKFSRVLLTSILFFFSATVSGQDFERAAGIRGGLTSGIEFRYFLDYKHSARVLLGNRDQGLVLHALYELHRKDLFGFTNRLSFIYGAGAHAGYQRWNKTSISGTSERERTYTRPLAGIDGVAGLEYFIFTIPVSAGIEVKPYADIWGKHGFDVVPWDFAFTLKYLF